MANESTSTTVDREAPATEPPPRKIGADPDHKIGDDHLDAERDLTSQTADERPGSGKFAGPHARVTGVASETVDVEGETVPVLRLELWEVETTPRIEELECAGSQVSATSIRLKVSLDTAIPLPSWHEQRSWRNFESDVTLVPDVLHGGESDLPDPGLLLY